MTHNTSDSFWKEIEKRKVSPIAPWKFHLKNYGLWFMVILLGFVSSVTITVIYYVLYHHDRDVDKRLYSGFADWVALVLNILDSIPYFWIVIVAIFSMITVYLLRSSKKGYRYSRRMVSGMGLISVIMFSGLLSFFDTGKLIHRYLSTHVAAYDKIVYGNEQQWSQPENGYLGGMIIQYSDSAHIIEIRDYHGFVWAVDISVADIKKGTRLDSGIHVKITGVQTGEGHFKASSIQGWDEMYSSSPLTENFICYDISLFGV